MVRGRVFRSIDAVASDPPGGQLLLNFIVAQSVEELYDPPQRFVEGQTIQVQEVVRIFCEILVEEAVDRDLRWYGGKTYVGTYRLNASAFLPSFSTAGEEGFINDLVYEIEQRSYYTVVPPRGREGATFGGTGIDNCNFETQTSIQIVPPNAAPQPVQRLISDSQIFTGDISIDYPLLGAKDFEPKIQTVGLYINAGLRFVRAEYIRNVVNEVELRRDPIRDRIPCKFPDSPCDAEFAAVLGSGDPIQVGYPTLAAIQAAALLLDNTVPPTTFFFDSITIQEFVCSTGETRPYWQFNISEG